PRGDQAIRRPRHHGVDDPLSLRSQAQAHLITRRPRELDNAAMAIAVGRVAHRCDRVRTDKDTSGRVVVAGSRVDEARLGVAVLIRTLAAYCSSANDPLIDGVS